MSFLGQMIGAVARWAGVQVASTGPRARSTSTGRNGGYAGGDSSRLYSQWTTTPVPHDTVIRSQRRTLVARSRDVAMNHSHGRRFVGMAKQNVVGPLGIRYQSRVIDQDGQTEPLTNDAIESAWKRWQLPRNCDVAQKLSFREMQNLYVETLLKDGEVLIRKIRGRQAGPFGFALQFLDPELLDVQFNADLTGGRKIRFGIEFDEWWRPLAYHLIDPTSRGDTYLAGYLANRHIRVDASEILHDFIAEAPGQKRGIPWFATTLDRMKMLRGYEEAALVNARAGASTAAFFENDPETATGFVGSGTPDSDGRQIEEIYPGMLRDLPPGKKLAVYDPIYPHAQYDPFMKQSLRALAAGLGASYQALAMDYSDVNFSSARTALLDERDAWMGMQEFLREHLMAPIFEDWIEMALLMGQIVRPGSAVTFDELPRLMSGIWMPRRWQWVDPAKDVKARIDAINARIASRTQAIMEQGRDPAEVFDELAREEATLKELGISPIQPAGPSLPDQEEPEKAEGDE